MKIFGILAGILFPFIITLQSYAQLHDPVTYQITHLPEEAEAGAVFDINIEASIEDGWHLYSILNDPDAGPYPTSFTSSSNDMVVAGESTESKAEIEYDPNFDIELGWHSGRATFTIPVAFKPGTREEQSVELDVFYQACDDISCLPPKTKTITASISLLKDAAPEYMYSGFLNENQPNRADRNSSWGWGEKAWIVYLLLTCLGAGLIVFIWGKLRVKLSSANRS